MGRLENEESFLERYERAQSIMQQAGRDYLRNVSQFGPGSPECDSAFKDFVRGAQVERAAFKDRRRQQSAAEFGTGKKRKRRGRGRLSGEG